ncbi:uracil-DNA glycosylase [Candidatus Nomurabacteria bacterium]|uniref:Type-4 uracil-DNA glycosylase n=1 Tax=candidate division WWE3 bacterium TaxID=2053526 RepID=A0A955IWR5_UNCKA|nr:uracil-DNA glycosylase [candidate division WWE3 bacterium]MCB9823826.1 uracil-DNA glycosylase [Candidatus Nomurabacteria bacterium]MCB9826768.1 uracil-DNA glycosylase [Candidatus Nomurabacteria bacterium]MCB9827621.1 uracil-DNA glycosylase [Candidatus Nomurabacteria bacterium]HXK52473.1 uracil-DNA glycosylase [bacterium]
MSQNTEKLQIIEREIRKCEKCSLCKTALQAVPGEGSSTAKVVFIGEAPGATEDKTGRPFVGRAGNLLEKLLEKINLSREEVWIGNIIKHRPPKNRDPLPEEIKACRGYLENQLAVIKPSLIVTLGRFAMNHFYPEGKITKDHGKLIKLHNFNVFPVYHPAAALRNRSFAEALAKDFLNIPNVLTELSKNEKSTNNTMMAKPLL